MPVAMCCTRACDGFPVGRMCDHVCTFLLAFQQKSLHELVCLCACMYG